MRHLKLRLMSGISRQGMVVPVMMSSFFGPNNKCNGAREVGQASCTLHIYAESDFGIHQIVLATARCDCCAGSSCFCKTDGTAACRAGLR